MHRSAGRRMWRCISSRAKRRILYYEQVSWLADNLLERSDRMTAAAALELRAPFLDHRVAEYVSALPDAARVRGLSTKWILRKADEKLLAGVKPRKAGFRIPLADLMRGAAPAAARALTTTARSSTA